MQVKYDYIAYIDEAGDPGLKRVRPIDPVGATEWLTLGAVLVRKRHEAEPPRWVGEILRDIGISQRPDLHYRNLTPARRLRVCQMMAELPVRYFVLTSNKKNMRQHRNERAAAKSYSQQWFYNWCARLLIERITDFVYRDSLLRHKEPRKVLFEFSRRGGHSYSQTGAYHELLKAQSRAQTAYLKRRVPRWEVMDRKLVISRDAKDGAGTQLADCVASSFYDAIDNLDTGACSVGPAKLLKPKMAFERMNGAQVISDYGVCLQPWPPYKAKLSRDQAEIFHYYGYRF